jgi:acetylornithine deacetylase
VRLVASLLDTNLPTIKVRYGTEGGLLAEDFDIPMLVCAPGEMARGTSLKNMSRFPKSKKSARFLERMVDVLGRRHT